MKEYFNVKRWHLITVWLIVFIGVTLQEDGSKLFGLLPTLLLFYTLGWLGYKNSGK